MKKYIANNLAASKALLLPRKREEPGPSRPKPKEKPSAPAKKLDKTLNDRPGAPRKPTLSFLKNSFARSSSNQTSQVG